MKLPKIVLLIPALAAMGISGCGTQSSSPVAVSPATQPAVNVPKNLDISPAETKPLLEREDPFWSEEKPQTEIKGALIQASKEDAGEDFPNAKSAPPEKPAVPDSAPTRPKADREPTKPGDPEKITFDDLILGMQADMVFRPFMLTDRAKELEGKRVRLTGEMYAGSVAGSEKLKEFIVLRNRECKYGAGGQADHVADVQMKEGHTTKFTIGTIRVEGTLRINPVNDDKTGVTNHIYVLEDAVVK